MSESVLQEIMAQIDTALGVSLMVEAPLLPRAGDDLREALFEAARLIREALEADDE